MGPKRAAPMKKPHCYGLICLMSEAIERPLNVPVKSYAELMAAYSTAGEGFHVACIEKCYGCVIPMAFQCSIALPRRVRY
jgi:hypothetical protein